MIDFTKLSEVPMVEEFPDGATVLIETEDEIKRCPSDGLGGGGDGDSPMVFYKVNTTRDEGTGEFALTGESPRFDDIIAMMRDGRYPVLITTINSSQFGTAETIFSNGVIQSYFVAEMPVSQSESIYGNGARAIVFHNHIMEVTLIDDGTSSRWEFSENV